MSVIWKYPISPKCTHEMPVGAQILAIQTQAGTPVIWALVDPDAPKESRAFVAFPTGVIFDATGLEYVGMFQTDGLLVFHVFERKSEAS